VIVTVTYHDHHLGTFSVQSLFFVISSSIFHIYSLINFPSYNHFLSIIDDSAQILVVCAGLNESAAARRVFFFTGGSGGASEQKIQDFQPSLR